jgi:hypothetical protein
VQAGVTQQPASDQANDETPPCRTDPSLVLTSTLQLPAFSALNGAAAISADIRFRDLLECEAPPIGSGDRRDTNDVQLWSDSRRSRACRKTVIPGLTGLLT